MLGQRVKPIYTPSPRLRLGHARRGPKHWLDVGSNLRDVAKITPASEGNPRSSTSSHISTVRIRGFVWGHPRGRDWALSIRPFYLSIIHPWRVEIMKNTQGSTSAQLGSAWVYSRGLLFTPNDSIRSTFSLEGEFSDGDLVVLEATIMA
jgi:hypothetical protein